MRCPRCDEVTNAAARFCTNCGVPLVSTAWADPASAAAGAAPLAAAAAAPSFAPAPGTPQSTLAAGYATPGYAAPPAQAAPSAYAPGYATPGYAYGSPYAYPPVQHIVNNVNVTAAVPGAAPDVPPLVVVQQPSAPPLALRALYFLLVGLWLGALWTVLAWLLIVSVIALPAGLWMINRLPRVMTLKPPSSEVTVSVQNGMLVVRQGAAMQRPFLVRAPYFLLVGWWASLLWLLIAWTVIAATAGLGLPIAFWMFNRVPAVTTLAR